MRSLFGIIVFLAVFALVGVGTHFALYNKAGVFIWSLNENGKPAKTKLKAEGPILIKPKSKETPKVGEQIKATENTDPEEVVEAPVIEEETPTDPNVIELFDGKQLGNWEITQYGGEGYVEVTEAGELELGFGASLTGVHWKEDPPKTSNYEITLDAMKLNGSDFFCGLTFPVKDSHATFIIGGWGGGVVGISSVDDLSANENETLKIEGFNDGVWYQVKLRVTDDKIMAWIDNELMVDLDLNNRKISLRPGDIELSEPIGLANFITRSKYRNIIWTNLPEAE